MKHYALYFAWLVSLIGLLVSLYYGEVLSYEPCRLCWYQRIALFPLAILLGVAAFRQDLRFANYALILAFIGEAFAVYHLLELHFPALRSAVLCGPVQSCHEAVVDFLGLSFPALSSTGFLLIICALLYSRHRSGS
jgi:disulfide bond formation protein DsbB